MHAFGAKRTDEGVPASQRHGGHDRFAGSTICHKRLRSAGTYTAKAFLPSHFSEADASMRERS